MRKLVIAIVLSLIAGAAVADTPETILCTYRPKVDKATELLTTLRETRAVYERLALVTGSYSLYRGTDSKGNVFFVEVFTWKGHEIPDNAPDAVLKQWAKEQALVEERNGRPGIEFHEVEMLSGGSSLPAAAPSK